MRGIEVVHTYVPRQSRMVADLTFGRDIAQYHQLVHFLATLSIGLWTCVIATIFLRLAARVIWRRRSYVTVKHDVVDE